MEPSTARWGRNPELYALEDARTCFDTMQSTAPNVPLKQRGEFPACGGTMEFYMELITTAPSSTCSSRAHRPVPLPGPRRHPLPHSSRRRAGRVDQCPDPSPAALSVTSATSSGFIDKANWCDKRTFVTIRTYSGTWISRYWKRCCHIPPAMWAWSAANPNGPESENLEERGGPVQRALSHRP